MSGAGTPIRSHLGVGADSARTIGELAEGLGVSRREVELAINEARMAGEPIVTDSRGAYLATTSQEARDASERLRTRALHQLETAAALRRAADAMEPDQQLRWLDAA